MRRTDIKVGAALAHKRSSYYPAEQVTVLDVEQDWCNYGTTVELWSKVSTRPRKGGARQLLVQLPNGLKLAARSVELIGDWATVDAEQTAAMEAQRARDAARRTVAEVRDVAIRRANAAGYPVEPRGLGAALDVETLVRLLDAAGVRA